MTIPITRYLGRTTPGGKRIVLAIAFDDEGVLDTITDTATGKALTSVSYDGRRILRNANAIYAGVAPLDYWQTSPPPAPAPDALSKLLNKLDEYLKAQATDDQPEDHWLRREGLRAALAEYRAA